MSLTGFSSKLCAEVAAHRNHSVLVINLLFIHSVACSCSQPLTAHFSAAHIQTFIPTFQPQPNRFIRECAVSWEAFSGTAIHQMEDWKLIIVGSTCYNFSSSCCSGSAENLMWILE
jgi:hypothetical protein